MDKKFKLNPYLGGVIYSSLFGLSFMFVMIGMNGTHGTFHLLALRFTVAFLFVWGLKQLNLIKVDLKGKNIKYLMYLSILEPILYFVFEAVGVSMTSSSEAGVMIGLLPIFTIIGAGIILKERTGSVQRLFILLSFIGVLLVNITSLFNSSGNILGLFFLFLMAVTASLFNVMSRKYSTEFTAGEITYVMMLVGAAVFNGISLVEHSMSGELHTYLAPLAQIETLGAIIFLGIFASVVAFLVLNYVLGEVEASKVSIFSNFTTVVAVLVGVFILGEAFTMIQILGCGFILAGVYGAAKFAIAQDDDEANTGKRFRKVATENS